MKKESKKVSKKKVSKKVTKKKVTKKKVSKKKVTKKKVTKKKVTKKKIVEILSSSTSVVGKVCFVSVTRSNFIGTVVSKDGNEVVLRNTRRISCHTHRCGMPPLFGGSCDSQESFQSNCPTSQFVTKGPLDGDEIMLADIEVAEVLLLGVTEIIPLTKEAIDVTENYCTALQKRLAGDC